MYYSSGMATILRGHRLSTSSILVIVGIIMTMYFGDVNSRGLPVSSVSRVQPSVRVSDQGQNLHAKAEIRPERDETSASMSQDDNFSTWEPQQTTSTTFATKPIQKVETATTLATTPINTLQMERSFWGSVGDTFGCAFGDLVSCAHTQKEVIDPMFKTAESWGSAIEKYAKKIGIGISAGVWASSCSVSKLNCDIANLAYDSDDCVHEYKQCVGKVSAACGGSINTCNALIQCLVAQVEGNQNGHVDHCTDAVLQGLGLLYTTSGIDDPLNWMSFVQAQQCVTNEAEMCADEEQKGG